jgi:hypothetical protein
MTTSGIKADFSGWQKAVEKLQGPLKVSLARSIAVGAGETLRDEAKLLAPKESGLLANSIYLAYKDGRSNEKEVVYSVSWNHLAAPHGHLIEFGHWQPYKVVKLPNGDWFTTKERLPSPKFIAAHPFLRPALDSAGKRAAQAGIERGRRRLPELLRESASGHRSDAENDA